MFYYIFKSHPGFPLVTVAVICTFAIAFVSFKMFSRLLPRDKGREFAVNAEKAQGKPRGAGIILISVFILCAALFTKINPEQIINLVLIYAAMLTGFLDDAAKVPWGELKKGLLDLGIAGGLVANYVICNKTQIILFDKIYTVPGPVYVILGVILVWTSINVVNCTDGVDGLCASLSMVTIFFFWQAGIGNTEMNYVMLAALAAYLWFNCSPSLILMGDAGSRALGVFIALIAMQSHRPHLFIPFAIVMIIDGGLGLLKLSVRRVFHSTTFMDGIRTPIHDHARKLKGYGDTQVVTRFVIVQVVICMAVIYLL